MAAKRISRKLTDVIAEVEARLIQDFNVSKALLNSWKAKAQTSPYAFPISTTVPIDAMWIDYEVQRDVLYKHIINIMKKWDSRVCSPGSACRLLGNDTIYLYDAQHRTIAAGLLGFTDLPCAVVETNDPNFASFAFELLNDTGVKRLNPGDLHRNALVRYKNNVRDTKVVAARVMQDQFDSCHVDLEDKNTRKSANLCGSNYHFFSHFKYAQKAIEVNQHGSVLKNILEAITNVFTKDAEIDQGVFIGLYELQRLQSSTTNVELPYGWMVTLLNSIKHTFNSSAIVHAKCKDQWEFKNPGATWSAPSAMSNFMREVHMRNGGKLNLMYHGTGSTMGIIDGFVAPGLFPIGA